MSAFLNSLTIASVNTARLTFDLQVVSVITLSIFLIQKLLSAAAANNSRFAYLLNFAVNPPLVALLMEFTVISVIRIIIVINQ